MAKADADYEIVCACGCGGALMRLDSRYRVRKYIHGHHNIDKLRNYSNSEENISRLKRHAFRKGLQPWNKGKGGVIKGICTHCNAEFAVAYKFRDQRFCCRACQWAEFTNKGALTRHENPMIGSRNPMWKGGTTTENRKLRAKFSKTTGKEVLARDGYTCTVCQKVGGELHVDHIKKWSEYPELRFDTSNCRTLCRACHFYVTFKRDIVDSTWGKFSRGTLNFNK